MIFHWVLFALAALSSLQAVSPTLKVVEKLASALSGWKQVSEPSSDTIIRFQIALHQPNAAVFEQCVIDLSTPDHPSYGRHISYDKVKEMLRPSADATTAVMSWLECEGIGNYRVQDDGDWIILQTSVSEAEKMLNTKFHKYHNPDSNTDAIKTLEYSLPQNLMPTSRWSNRPFGFARCTHKDLSSRRGDILTTHIRHTL